MQYLTSKEVLSLELKANSIRQSIIEMLTEAGSGHTAGPLGMADVFTLLYFGILKHDPKNPDWKERDRVILSNGHICPVLYATLAHSGYFPVEELLTLRKFGSRLQGHPHKGALPGIENSSGPLGSGLSLKLLGCRWLNESTTLIRLSFLLSNRRWRVKRGTNLGSFNVLAGKRKFK